MDFVHGMLKMTNYTETLNGAKTLETSGSFLLDFFSKAAALRGDQESVLRYFIGAYSESKELALKALFYIRDIRGGQGERDIFRNCIRYIALNHPDDIRKIVELIPEYGRWDDLYILGGTKLEDVAFDIMKKQFFKDINSDNPSLLAKWLKSVNTSSKLSRNIGKITAKKFGMPEVKYRKALSKIRKKLNILESQMTEKKWKQIDYSKVPSQAMLKHAKAFNRNDEERFCEYLESVLSGEKKIHSETLYPYQVIRTIFNSPYNNNNNIDAKQKKAMNVLWENLPNYMEEEENVIAVVDVSGSMYGEFIKDLRPITISVSLGIYFAERNTGIFKDTFITFSKNPKLQKIIGNDIYEKVVNVSKSDWGYNTNLIKTFKTIIDVAKENELKEEELPKKVYIISDMQFDVAIEDNSKTNFEAIDNMFKEAGYKRPKLVFWNVNAYSDVPIDMDENGTYLISGASPSILKYVMNCDSSTPYDFMLEVIKSERYSPICL
jgi:hypothetical protein